MIVLFLFSLLLKRHDTCFIIPAACTLAQIDPDDEDQAREWLQVYNTDAQVQYPLSIEAEWNYNTNLTDENLDKTVRSLHILHVNCDSLGTDFTKIHGVIKSH